MRQKKSKYNEKPINIDGLEFHNSPPSLSPSFLKQTYQLSSKIALKYPTICLRGAYGEGARNNIRISLSVMVAY